MKSCYLFMIFFGGVIGMGLFFNLGYIISVVGFGGIFFVYLIGGLIMYLVMICLGELSVVMFVLGLF